MFDDVLHQFEEPLSELWVLYSIILNHLQSALDKAIEDLLQEARKRLAHLFEHRAEQQQYLRVPGLGVTLLVVFNQRFQRRQEVLGKDLKVLFFVYVCLDQTQDVPTNCFHGLDQLVLGLHRVHHSLRDKVRVQLVHLDQVRKYVLQVMNVNRSNRVSHALVRLYCLVYQLDLLGDHQLVHILVRLLQDLLKVVVGVLQQLVHKIDLPVGLLL